MSQIRRAPRKEKFTVLHNATLEDDSLSWEALGLLAFLLSKPDNWTVSKRHLISIRDAGQHKMTRLINELEEAGYLVRQRTHGEDGTFRWESTLYDRPHQNQSTIPQSSRGGSPKDGSTKDGKPPDIIKTEGNKDGSSKNGVSSSSGGSAREDLDFLADEYRQAYGKTIRECINQFSTSSVDQLIRNQWGGYRQGRIPTSDLVALAQSHDFPRLVAAVVITGNEAQTPNVRYLSSVLQGDFQSKSKSNGRSNEDIPDDPIENRKRILRAAAEGAGLT